MNRFLRASFYLFAVTLISSCNNAEEKRLQEEEIYSSATIAPYTEAIMEDSLDASAYYKRSLALSQIRKDSLAIKDINKAISLDPKNAAYYSFAGELYNYIDDYGEALKSYYKAAEIDAKDLRIQINIIKTLLFDDQIATAKAKVNHLIKIIPDYPDAYYWNGMIHLLENDTTAALELLEHSLELDPYFYEASLKLGDLYAAQKNKAAINQYLYTYGLDTNDIYPLYQIGNYYVTINDPINAKNAFRKSLTYNAEYTPAYIGIGKILLEEDSIEKAKRTFYIASKTAPENDEIYTHLGQIYEKLKIVDSAKLYYANALNINKKNKLAQEGLSRLK